MQKIKEDSETEIMFSSLIFIIEVDYCLRDWAYVFVLDYLDYHNAPYPIAKLWNMKTDACSFSIDFLYMISRVKSHLTPWPARETGFVNYTQSRQNGGVCSTLWGKNLKWVWAQVICGGTGAETVDSLGQIAFYKRARHQGCKPQKTQLQHSQLRISFQWTVSVVSDLFTAL